MPSDSELMAITGLRSNHAVCTHVERLIDPASYAHDVVHRLLPGPRGAHLPVLGAIAAGFPSPADEELTDTMSLDEYLISNREATYILKVNGNSMIVLASCPATCSSSSAAPIPVTAISSSPKSTANGP